MQLDSVPTEHGEAQFSPPTAWLQALSDLARLDGDSDQAFQAGAA
jgi:hypothetical protein